jgi:hypothetical protein
MARVVLTDAVVKIGSTDLSDHVASVEIAVEKDAIETTAFGQTGRTRIGGLEDSSISLDFHQDFDPAEVDATVFPLVGTVVAFEILPKGTAVGTANPKFTGNVLVTEWGFGGAIGELATKSVTWPVSGSVTRGTA